MAALVGIGSFIAGDRLADRPLPPDPPPIVIVQSDIDGSMYSEEAILRNANEAQSQADLLDFLTAGALCEDLIKADRPPGELHFLYYFKTVKTSPMSFVLKYYLTPYQGEPEAKLLSRPVLYDCRIVGPGDATISSVPEARYLDVIIDVFLPNALDQLRSRFRGGG